LNRFLIIRLGALGDVVHAIPVAAALRRSFPAARIDWLVSSKHREILDLVPVIDRRLAINDRAGAVGGATLVGAIRELRHERYDAAFDLQGLVKSAALGRASGAAHVVGFSASYLRERLARFFYTDTHDPGAGGLYDPRETRHIAQINLTLLEAIGVTTSVADFPIESAASDAAARVRDETGGRYALLNPCAAWSNKRWPPARFGAVAAALRERHRLASVVLWGPGEQRIAADVVAASDGAALASPPTSIADLVAIARGATLMVAGDTGPTHIAAAVGTPIVGIFGPTRPSRNGPWRLEDLTVSRDATCQCHHLRRCKLATMCLMDIEVAEVLDAIERRLAVAP